MKPKQTVLIVEDESGVREALKLILSDIYDLKFAENGPEGLALLSKMDYEVVLLDIKMPKMNGLEVLKQIKADKPKLPVILITGYQSEEIAREAIRLGAFDYIPKPFESEQILKTVAKAVEISAK